MTDDLLSTSASQTQAIGRALGERLEPGDVLALTGGLGAGKTVFVKGLASGLGVAADAVVTSPTFVLISEYEGRLTLYHVDAYRLERAADFIALGADEILFGDGVCVVEWADRVAECLPADRLDVAFDVEGEAARRIRFAPRGTRWAARWPEVISSVKCQVSSGK